MYLSAGRSLGRLPVFKLSQRFFTFSNAPAAVAAAATVAGSAATTATSFRVASAIPRRTATTTTTTTTTTRGTHFTTLTRGTTTPLAPAFGFASCFRELGLEYLGREAAGVWRQRRPSKLYESAPVLARLLTW
eukprot:GHVT01020536.1.p1 GENE.GHVT01020536.1~~GHVT01020536.1.p1  ORF type:complete len:133 (+),score=27.78 GHVT01020536.1:355-753(+)